LGGIREFELKIGSMNLLYERTILVNQFLRDRQKESAMRLMLAKDQHNLLSQERKQLGKIRGHFEVFKERKLTEPPREGPIDA